MVVTVNKKEFTLDICCDEMVNATIFLIATTLLGNVNDIVVMTKNEGSYHESKWFSLDQFKKSSQYALNPWTVLNYTKAMQNCPHKRTYVLRSLAIMSEYIFQNPIQI